MVAADLIGKNGNHVLVRTVQEMRLYNPFVGSAVVTQTKSSLVTDSGLYDVLNVRDHDGVI